MGNVTGAFAERRKPLSDSDPGTGGPRLLPDALVHGAAAADLGAAGRALPLAGGPVAFTQARVLGADAPPDAILSVPELRRWAEEAAAAGKEGPHALLERLSAPRPPLAGLSLSEPDGRPRLMGIVNVTPDSFSDGGAHAEPAAAIAHARRLVADGADIVDIGGESTRPGAAPVGEEEEVRRIVPVIEALAGDGAVVSVDTRHAGVMRRALAAGARIVNDVTALEGDPDSLAAIAASDAAVILMHMQGTPETMQADPHYADVVAEVHHYLAARMAACTAAGIDRARLCVDPGFGFGKTVRHNFELFAAMTAFHGLGAPLCIGVSRKSFVGRVSSAQDPKGRLAGSLAMMLGAVARGAQIIRVHDVAESRQALDTLLATMAPERVG